MRKIWRDIDPGSWTATTPYRYEGKCGMAFVLAVFLFVVVIGVIDAGLPWPDPKSKKARP